VTLFPTKEGALVARRDNELSASTDVAAHPEFADRKTTKTIGDHEVTGWFLEDFTLAEVRTLLCHERLPALRPQTQRYNGKEGVLTLAEVLQLARDGCVRTARTIGVCARLARASAFETLGLDVVARLADDLTTAGYFAPAAAVWVQASDPETLKAFGKLSRVRRMQLLDAGDAALTTQGALADIRAYAEAIGPDQDLLLDPAAAVFPAPTTLALDAHNAGLQVFSRTARAENAFLPPVLRKGDRRSASYGAYHGDVDRLLVALFADGVDGLATDLPAQAVRARQAVADAIERGKIAAPPSR
jgi:glycerophosphoryl diester phosphodiesterase